MELQFNKTVVPCLKSVMREVQTQEQTQEVKLTDGMPYIGRVLASWGQLLIRGKEWRSGGMSVSGGVMVWVLYAPEEGGEPRCVETWLPFQMKWDFPDTERDGMICIDPLLRGVDARSVSARKLMVRAGIGILGEAMISSDVEVFSPGELPEDVHILKNAYPMLLPREAGEKAFVLDMALSLPASAPGLEKLIRYELQTELAEQKIVADKLVFRGMATLHILYQGIDGQLYGWDFEAPFSQYAELDKEYDTDATARVSFAVTSVELEQGEEENLGLKAGLTGQYVVYDRPVIELVEDAYSPNRPVIPQMSNLRIPAVLDTHTETVHADQTVDINGTRAVDVTFYPDHPRLHREGDKVAAELSGVFQLLGYDENGQLQSASSRWEENWALDADEDASMEVAVQPSGKPQVTTGSGSASVRTDLLLNARTTSEQGLPMVAGVELGEFSEPDPNRPSLILRRADRDRLWDIAKQTGSTVEAIQKANNLQQEPVGGQILLIPVS